MTFFSKYPLSSVIFNALAVVWIVCLSLGQLGRWNLTSQVALYPSDVLGGLLALWQLAHVWQQGIPFHKISRVTLITKIIIATLALIIGMGWAAAAVQGRISFLVIFYLSRSFTYPIAVWSVLEKWGKTTFSQWWVGLGASWVLLGLAQWILLPDTRFLAVLGWDDHYYRLVGTFFDPNLLSVAIVISGWLVTKSGVLKTIKIPLLLMHFVTLLLTYSRTGLLGGVVLLTSAILSTKGQRAQFALAACVLILGFLWIPTPLGATSTTTLTRTASVQNRWQSQLSQLQHLTPLEWVIGRGLLVPNAPDAENPLPSHAKFADSSAAFLLTNLGVLGTALVGVLLLQFLWGAYRTQPQLLPLLASTLAMSLTNHLLTHPLLVPFWWGSVMVIWKAKK